MYIEDSLWRQEGLNDMKEINKLTDLEVEIMGVLWNSKDNLTIQQITDKLNSYSIPSITQAMKHLVNKKAVVVAEHILVSNVYARTFKTCYTPEDYFEAELKRLRKLAGIQN